MEDKLIPFDYHGHAVRTVMIDGEPWFVAKDVCEVLEIANANMAAARLENDEVSQTEVIDGMGRKQPTNVLNVMGLYDLILRSDKPEAKPPQAGTRLCVGSEFIATCVTGLSGKRFSWDFIK